MTAERLRNEACCLTDARWRRLAEVAFDIFVRHGRARLDTMRAQVVHNNTGPANLLADTASPGGIAGVLDFGNMTHGPRIVDPVISPVKLAQGRSRRVEICARLFGGYGAGLPQGTLGPPP